MSPPREHSATTEQDPGPTPVPETTHAERARTLLHLGRLGVLSTHSQKREGFPFGSLMPYALDGEARPLFLISTMAMHTHNLMGDPRAGLFVAQDEVDKDPLGAGRLTVVGKAAKVPKAELKGVREAYLGRHENARYWVDFKDFSFYRLEIVDVYYVGGFGVMGWVEAGDFMAAEPDPLAEEASGILAHMNADHADALVLLARAHKGIEAREAKMVAVDRLGFHVRLTTPERVRAVRIGFPAEVRTPTDCRSAFIKMIKAARS